MVPMACQVEQYPGVCGAGWASNTASVQQERDTTLLTWVTYGCATSCSQQKFTGVRVGKLSSPLSWESVTHWDGKAGGHPFRCRAPVQVTAQHGGLMSWYSTRRHSMAHCGTPRTARHVGTNHALLLLPRAGTSCLSGRTGPGGRRPGRTAGMAMTTSSWTWEASSLHTGQVGCHHPWCSAPPAAPWPLPQHPFSPWHVRTLIVALCDAPKLQIDGRISSLQLGRFLALHMFYSWRNRAERCSQLLSGIPAQ